jgi:FixJ family two-component response regulator
MYGLEFRSAIRAEFGDLPSLVMVLTGVKDQRVAIRSMKAGGAD